MKHVSVAKNKQAETEELVPSSTDMPEAPNCPHQWIIDSPSGPTSLGICSICKEERQFQNYIEGSSWGYDVSIDQLVGEGRIPKSSNHKQNYRENEEE